MGLDGVELILATEECFGISISDADASTIVTVGDLEKLVLTALAGRPRTEQTRDSICLSSHTFYRLRKALRKLLGTPREQIRPDASCNNIIPTENRRALWRQLAVELGWDLPELYRPKWVSTLFSAITLGGVLASVFLGMADGIEKAQAWLLGLGSMGFGFAAARLTRPLAIHFPSDCIHLRDLAEIVLQRNLPRIRKDIGTWQAHDGVWNEAEAKSIVRRLICEELGVKPEQLGPDVRFVADLGMD